MSKNTKKLLAFLVSVIVLVYASGAIYFTMNSYPKTKVNGIDRSGVSKEEIFNITQEVKELVVKGREGRELKLSPDKIGYTKVVLGKPEHKQNPLLWPIQVFKSHEYELDYKVRYDQAKLDDLLENSDILKNQKNPVDAKIQYNDKKENFEIIAEEKGSKISQDNLKKAVIQGLESEKNTVDLEEFYEKPKITSTDKKIKDQFAELDGLLEGEYTLDFEDRKYTLTGESLFEMYDQTEEGYVLNYDRIYSFVKEIAKETDTYGRKRKFKATGLGEITVEPGIYGWLMDVKKTTNNLVSNIDEKKVGNVDIKYLKSNGFSYTAMSRKKNDIGDTYLEADLSRQTFWFYKDGKLVLTSPFVSGQANVRNAATPVGVNKVRDKQSPKVLVGINEMSGKEYAVDVKYWINVGWTGSGFHDVDYRKKFGGDIYKTFGSSSCINTPLEVMEKLYPMIEYGTPVVLYESSTNYSPTEFEKQKINADRLAAKKEEESKKAKSSEAKKTDDNKKRNE